MAKYREWWRRRGKEGRGEACNREGSRGGSLSTRRANWLSRYKRAHASRHNIALFSVTGSVARAVAYNSCTSDVMRATTRANLAYIRNLLCSVSSHFYEGIPRTPII